MATTRYSLRVLHFETFRLLVQLPFLVQVLALVTSTGHLRTRPYRCSVNNSQKVQICVQIFLLNACTRLKVLILGKPSAPLESFAPCQETTPFDSSTSITRGAPGTVEYSLDITWRLDPNLKLLNEHIHRRRTDDSALSDHNSVRSIYLYTYTKVEMGLVAPCPPDATHSTIVRIYHFISRCGCFDSTI